jgi:hypothetical protein
MAAAEKMKDLLNPLKLLTGVLPTAKQYLEAEPPPLNP